MRSPRTSTVSSNSNNELKDGNFKDGNFMVHPLKIADLPRDKING
jgi:hypothetical protein